MNKPDPRKLLQRTNFLKGMCLAAIAELEDFREQLEKDESIYKYANSSRASYKQLRQVIIKELLKMERYIYGKD